MRRQTAFYRVTTVGLLALAVILAGGCGDDTPPTPEPSAERWREVGLGMTKAQVLEIMGPPDSIESRARLWAFKWVEGTLDDTRWNYRVLNRGAFIVDFDGEIVIRKGFLG